MTALRKDEQAEQRHIADIEMRAANARIVSRLRAEVAAAPFSSRYSRDELETMYAIAYSYCTHSRFDVALPLFKFLTIYSPTTAHYISGLGLCLQRLERYDDAVAVYRYVDVLEPDQLIIGLRVAECMLSLHQIEEASELLGLIVQYAADTGVKSAESARAAAILALLANGTGRQTPEGGSKDKAQKDDQREASSDAAAGNVEMDTGAARQSAQR